MMDSLDLSNDAGRSAKDMWQAEWYAGLALAGMCASGQLDLLQPYDPVRYDELARKAQKLGVHMMVALADILQNGVNHKEVASG